MKRKTAVILSITLLFGVLCLVILVMLFRTTGEAFTVSKETTYLTEPLKPNGAVDYVLALNRMCGKGVTPANNAAVPLYEACGPKNIDVNIRANFFRMLGIAPLPEKGGYLIPINEYFEKIEAESDAAGNAENQEKRREREDKFYEITTSPWSADEQPLAAKWLEGNRKALEKIREASRRPKFYVPLVSEGEFSVLADAFCPMMELRESGRLLMAQAMLSIRQKKFKEAQEDMLACHRLARLASQSPTIIDALVAIAVDGMAVKGDVALAQSGGLNSQEAAAYMQELRNLPPLPKMVDKIDTAERFYFLDYISIIAKGGAGRKNGGDSAIGVKDETLNSLMTSISNSTFDWNIILKHGNNAYDRIVEILHKPTRAERTEELAKETKRQMVDMKPLKTIWNSLLEGNSIQQIKSKTIGNVFVGLILPAVEAACNSEVSAQVRVDFSQLALALSAYRHDQNRYPEALSELVPQYLPELPKDRYSDADYHYRREGNGYLFYSVGRDGKDDGGKSTNADADPPDETGDDIAIRTPKDP